MLACAAGCGGGAKSAQPTCATGNGGCDPLTTCTDTAGGTTCGPCPADYAGTGETGCVDPLACAGAQLLLLTQATAPVTQNVPASCGGSPALCCPGGNPVDPCGPLEVDFRAQAGDTPRLETVLGPDRLDVTLRARVRSVAAIPIALPVVGDCAFTVDTAPGPTPDVELDMAIDRVTDASGPHLVIATTTLVGFTADDIVLTGGLGCTLANLGLSLFLGTLTSMFQDSVQLPLCSTCPC
jgi:hypothetical protein